MPVFSNIVVYMFLLYSDMLNHKESVNFQVILASGEWFILFC